MKIYSRLLIPMKTNIYIYITDLENGRFLTSYETPMRNCFINYLYTSIRYPSRKRRLTNRILQTVRSYLPFQSLLIASHSFEICFEFSTQRVLWSSSVLLAFWIRSDCLDIQSDGIDNACRTHIQRLVLLSYSYGSWFVLFYGVSLLMASGQLILIVLYRQLFMKTCIF